MQEGDVKEFDHIEHIPIKQNHPHPCYNSNTMQNNIMVLELQWSTVKYKDYVIELDTPIGGVDLFDGKPLSSMGFGNLFSYRYSFGPDIMQEATEPYTSTCGTYTTITDDMLCAGAQGEGTCQVREKIHLHFTGLILCPCLQFLPISPLTA